MSVASFNDDLLAFINASPTPFHAVANMRDTLLQAGFIELHEGNAWHLQAGQRYLLTRNDSSIIAFVYGKQSLMEAGIRMVGAHTDSPCLRVKPNPDIKSAGYAQLGVEVYGGVLLNPWFDRELSLAGRVSVLDAKGHLHHVLVNFNRPVGMIPGLAIHLDRDANKNHSINAQTDLPVMLGLVPADGKLDFTEVLLQQVWAEHSELDITRIVDFELSFYDIQPGTMYGINNEFIAAARLDNLLSCFVGMQALLEADGEQSCLLICNDHEEVGSGSACGADGTMLNNFLQRLLPGNEDFIRAINHSLLVSADNAHGIHPNFVDKHDTNHGPMLNAGPVIKINAKQRYASNSETQAIFRVLCENNNIPVQSFVVRSDMACGSTIGPITASILGVRTVDVGVPTFAMHSIRETAGSQDAWYLCQVLGAFFRKEKI